MAEIDYSQVTGLVHSTESFGSVDGPGIRFIVFMQGCKMRCQYCHNPDTWAMESNKAVERTVEDVLDEALRFRHFWGEHGGITVSGGEAMLQIDFVTALFTEAKKLGIHCTLDTCGFAYRNTPEYHEVVDKLLAVTDLVLLDIKEIDPEQHKFVTRQPNKNILEFAQYLSDKQVPVWIRHVLVPGLTDFDEHLVKLGEFVKTLKNLKFFPIIQWVSSNGVSSVFHILWKGSNHQRQIVSKMPKLSCTLKRIKSIKIVSVLKPWIKTEALDKSFLTLLLFREQ